jgi:LacI family transcriptional regulator
MASPSQPNSGNRPTLRLIAQKAGISLTATSMALRNHSGISLETRKRVQALALQLGYHPDPKLSTLMQHLRIHSAVEYRETLAFLSMWPNHESWRRISQHDFYLGAQEQASELGYRVDLFHLKEPGMTDKRMSKLLTARGIHGLLIGPSLKPNGRLDLDWEHFAAITFGYSVATPPLHRVTTNYYSEMLSTLHRLKNEGCKRIGLNLSISDDNKVQNLWRSAYLLFNGNLPPKERIPITTVPSGESAIKLRQSKIFEWVRQFKPDAIISAGCDFPQLYELAYRKSPSKSIRYVNMNIHHTDNRSRGIDQDSWAIGRLACSHLIAMLQRNETGLPQQPQIISIEGKWVEDYDAWLRTLGARTPPAAIIESMARLGKKAPATR